MKNSLIGKIEVQIYDKENNLKEVVKGKNTVTTAGIKRICEILTQGKREGIVNTESLEEIPLNTLTNGQNAMGLNIIDWKDKKYTTCEFSENISGISQPNSMFEENSQDGNYAVMEKGNASTKEFKDFYSPNKDEKNNRNTSGWVFDLGLKHIYNRKLNFSVNEFYFPQKNMKYNSLSIKDRKGKKLVEGFWKDGKVVDENDNPADYIMISWGDYENFPKIYLTDYCLNKDLFFTYSYYNVPTVPIVGFCFDCVCTDNDYTNSQNFIAGWSWSLNQGKSRLPNFFPNLAGCPSGNSVENIDNDNAHYGAIQTSWFNPFGQEEKRFYIHSYPYGVINPTQLVWYAHLHNSTPKCYFKNFSLLGVSIPKLGSQVIKLGSGKGTPSAKDTRLFEEITDSTMLIKTKRNNGTDSVKFEIKLGFDDCNSDKEITEIGLFFPENDNALYSDADYWNNGVENKGSGKNNKDISGKNRIVKYDGVNKSDCKTMFSHGFFETPWIKKKDEKVTIVYTVQINWGDEINE